MKWTLLFGFAFLLFLAAGASAADMLSVVYVEGSAQVQSGSTWKEIAIGDPVLPDASIRVGTASFLQIKGAGVDFCVSRPGTYSVKDLLAARRTLVAARAGAVVSGSIRYLLTGPSQRRSAALGTRGAEAAETEDSGWAESSADVLLAAAKEYITAGKYAEAIDQLTQARKAASPQELPEVRYYSACALSMSGDVREAWQQISDLEPPVGASWRLDFVLLKAKLLVDTSAYAEAAALLAHDGAVLSGDAQRSPLYFFLLGLGYQGSGDRQKARESLSKVVETVATSDMGNAARQLLNAP